MRKGRRDVAPFSSFLWGYRLLFSLLSFVFLIVLVVPYALKPTGTGRTTGTGSTTTATVIDIGVITIYMGYDIATVIYITLSKNCCCLNLHYFY